MKLKLHVWRQNGPNDKGKLETYEAPHVSPDQSFLEMLDDVNLDLARTGRDIIAFDHDCLANVEPPKVFGDVAPELDIFFL